MVEKDRKIIAPLSQNENNNQFKWTKWNKTERKRENAGKHLGENVKEILEKKHTLKMREPNKSDLKIGRIAGWAKNENLCLVVLYPE